MAPLHATHPHKTNQEFYYVPFNQHALSFLRCNINCDNDVSFLSFIIYCRGKPSHQTSPCKRNTNSRGNRVWFIYISIINSSYYFVNYLPWLWNLMNKDVFSARTSAILVWKHKDIVSFSRWCIILFLEMIQKLNKANHLQMYF